MGRGPHESPSVLEVVLQQWPLLIFVPAILVLLAALVAVTRWWDLRDGMRVPENTAREKWWLRWRREERCTCSWHTIATEVRAESG